MLTTMVADVDRLTMRRNVPGHCQNSGPRDLDWASNEQELGQARQGPNKSWASPRTRYSYMLAGAQESGPRSTWIDAVLRIKD